MHERFAVSRIVHREPPTQGDVMAVQRMREFTVDVELQLLMPIIQQKVQRGSTHSVPALRALWDEAVKAGANHEPSFRTFCSVNGPNVTRFASRDRCGKLLRQGRYSSQGLRLKREFLAQFPIDDHDRGSGIQHEIVWTMPVHHYGDDHRKSVHQMKRHEVGRRLGSGALADECSTVQSTIRRTDKQRAGPRLHIRAPVKRETKPVPKTTRELDLMLPSSATSV